MPSILLIKRLNFFLICLISSEGEPLKGSRASLSSSIKIESEEEASLSEYGDIDAGKFTEDGSFIGDYGADKKRANANAQTEKA